MLLILLAMGILGTALASECTMSAIVSFQTCVIYCYNKYGTDDDTQRKYYNRNTGNCEKAVICKTTAYRIYENRCLADFESYAIGDTRTTIPEIYQ